MYAPQLGYNPVNGFAGALAALVADLYNERRRSGNTLDIIGFGMTGAALAQYCTRAFIATICPLPN